MQIEKKLILCSILAITIGIATIVPLAFFMSPAQAQTTEAMPWFNLEIPYAYYAASSQTGADGYLVGIGVIHDLVHYSSAYAIGLNYSINPAAVNTLTGARIEYYELQIYSDQGQIANITTYLGANCTSNIEPTSFHFDRDDWFNTTTNVGGTFVVNFTGSLYGVSNSEISGDESSNSFANTTLPQNFLNLQNAQTVDIDVRRLGYVTFNGNSTVVTLANNEVIQHIELTKNGDNFSYGNVPSNSMRLPTASSILIPPQQP